MCSVTKDVRPTTGSDVLLASSLLEWIDTLLLPQGNAARALAPSLRSPDPGLPSLGGDKVKKAQRSLIVEPRN